MSGYFEFLWGYFRFMQVGLKQIFYDPKMLSTISTTIPQGSKYNPFLASDAPFKDMIV